ncbi:glycosyl transferase [Pseudoxanthomonas indica]|nr:glycosyl transferase [Pseudoxanthomonas indica]
MTDAAVRPARIDKSIGINVVGYLRGEFGLAEAARLYAGALIASGHDVAMRSVELALPHGWDDRSLEPWITDQTPHADTLVFVNPDYLAQVVDHLALRRDPDHRLYACWFWELETVPAHWQRAIDAVDGILVASKFVEQAFRARTEKPVLRVPLPVTQPPLLPMTRSDFDLEEGVFVFLCMFDFHSAIERKNPHAAIAAFRAAFPPARNDVRLLIKTSNAAAAPDQLAGLLAAIGDDARIRVRDQHLHRSHLHALQACCDVYLSLHRAEGFGLGMAEAMALGKPVIATAWSGNLDFMDDHNSLLINCQLVPVPAGAYPDAAGARWAEPDIHAAAAAMARLADDPSQARELGERARISVLETLSAPRAASQIHDWIARQAQSLSTPHSAIHEQQASHP